MTATTSPPAAPTVGLFGVGHVGGSVARALLVSGTARHLLLCDPDQPRVEGECLDLQHAAPLCPPCELRVASAAETAQADVVVIAAGRSTRPGETRLELLRDNVAMAVELGDGLRDAPGLVVVVSNPLDVLTRIVQERSGLPPSRVLGTGTMLDSARLRTAIAARLGCDAGSVEAHVVGEHGLSQVAHWSGARAGGQPLRRWRGWNQRIESELETEVTQAAPRIVQLKGATWQAIGLVCADLVRCIVRDERRILTVARVQDEPEELRGLALSLPTLVGAKGGETVLQPTLDTHETERLRTGAEVLENTYRLAMDRPD